MFLFNDKNQVAAHTLLMNRTFSRFVGKVMNLTLYRLICFINYSPKSWRQPVYSKVSKWIGIDVDEFAYIFMFCFILVATLKTIQLPTASSPVT